jgi:hypothetical protein
MAQAAAPHPGVYTSPFTLALGYAYLHDQEKALSYLQQSVPDHEGQILFMKYEPSFEEIRGDPRFLAIEKQVGLIPLSTVRQAPCECLRIVGCAPPIQAPCRKRTRSCRMIRNSPTGLRCCKT